MGNCLTADVKSTKSQVGEFHSVDSVVRTEMEAKEIAIGALGYCSWIVLHLQCRKLKNADLFSKSDALGFLYEWRDESWVEAGRTEMIANSLEPIFTRTFKVLYHFERLQKYRILMVDVDKGQDPQKLHPDDCNFLGACEFALGEVVTAPGKKFVRNLVNRRGENLDSKAVLLAEEASDSKEVYRIRLSASRLRNVERFGKSDPFIQFSRCQEDGEWLPVYKTRVIKNNLNPVWEEFAVRATQLNNGDVMRPLRIRVFDYEPTGSHRLLGQCEVSTEHLMGLASQHGACLSLQPPGPGKPSGDYGMLQVLSFSVETSATFLDYLAGGTEIGFVVAVDFTASNGNPNTPSSKHYYSDGMTEYERAITGVGHILEYYDQDKVFPMFGFGGQYQRSPTNHCFPMGTLPDSTCIGVTGLLQAYRQALSTWKLSGPTLFAPVIRKASQLASETIASKPPKYTVLLILTDGAIMDMDDTIGAIITASVLPLSILIVGIGSDDFGDMNKLDGDKSRLSSGNRTAVRDIVQFVEFYKYQGDGIRLAQEVLRELPGQLLEYMKINRIQCPPPLNTLPTMAIPTGSPGRTGAAIAREGRPEGAIPASIAAN
ncbi:hypothetical protein VaNZ11_013362 [Volvox africanus]|uniref:C2 domain-containing protein n=1 Tax=Volvox africanus TaxID=51714 RepID=A0ABQ5SH08_9CHLO|nr:hypothetical protein VaNZ11_013362 [Volvox africanus]